MLDDFDDLDGTEKAGVGAELNRCRALAAKIANELRNKRPEHFIDKVAMADIHASLERAADVLSTVKGSQARHHSIPRSVTSSTGLPRTSSYSPGRRLLNMVGK